MRGRQGRVGLALVATALLGAAVLGGPAAAQEADEVEVTIDRRALLAYPINDAIPDTLLDAFPPQVVCVVLPDACPEELEPVREPIGDALGEVDGNDQTSPLQPAAPDGLTVTYLAGTPRYATAAAFEVPEIPDGHEYDQVVLEFPQADPSYSVSSPAFRRVVTALIQTAGSQDPEVLQEELAKLQEEEPLTQPPPGIQACPLTQPFPEDAAPPRSAPISSVSEENADGEVVPAVECLYGATGTLQDGTWSFDLTGMAGAWADGTLDDHGVLFRPTGVENLAFGDGDTSTNSQVVLDASGPVTARIASSEPAEEVATLDELADAPSGGSGSTDPIESTVSSPPSSQIDDPAPMADEAPPAEVAAPAEEPQAETPSVALDADPATTPHTPAYVWLLVPVFAAGMWLVSRSLTEELATAPARRGALTRLVEARN